MPLASLTDSRRSCARSARLRFTTVVPNRSTPPGDGPPGVDRPCVAAPIRDIEDADVSAGQPLVGDQRVTSKASLSDVFSLPPLLDSVLVHRAPRVRVAEAAL